MLDSAGSNNKINSLTMTISDFNQLNKSEAENALFECCGSSNWVSVLMKNFPFKNEMDLITKSGECWFSKCNETDWLEAFTRHPKIGDVKSLTEKFASTSHLAGDEQSGVNVATKDIIELLAKANDQYESKYGFIFIVCATGKSANEMLQLLQDRLHNNREEELNIAMGEQQKITLLRLKKLLSSSTENNQLVSQITTHVLDTSIGKPGANITIRLKKAVSTDWTTIAQGVTNKDGRIADLLPASISLQPGIYKMVFDTGKYFSDSKVDGFYPAVEIQFTVFDNSHYHVPLLINPFGYSTYRGS